MAPSMKEVVYSRMGRSVEGGALKARRETLDARGETRDARCETRDGMKRPTSAGSSKLAPMEGTKPKGGRP